MERKLGVTVSALKLNSTERSAFVVNVRARVRGVKRDLALPPDA
jgi:hypothetical protein